MVPSNRQATKGMKTIRHCRLFNSPFNIGSVQFEKIVKTVDVLHRQTLVCIVDEWQLVDRNQLVKFFITNFSQLCLGLAAVRHDPTQPDATRQRSRA